MTSETQFGAARHPKVSVIMPAYNCSGYIEAAIRSVMAQTFSDWELIVLDDGSTDDTREIVVRLAEEDSRIRSCPNERNMGVAKTRNRGMDLCQGDYVALLDSDDWWTPDKLETQLMLAEQTGADLIYCSYAIVDENDHPICEDFIVPKTTNYQDSLVQSVISCSTVLMSRAIVDRYRFCTDFYHEDLVLWLEILRDGYRAAGAEKVLAAYRILQGSRASNKFKSAVERWKIYRKRMKEPFLPSVKWIIQYALLALKKYKRV